MGRSAAAEAAGAGRPSSLIARWYWPGVRQPGRTPGLGDLLNRADLGDVRAAEALEKMAHYLGRGMRMIVAGPPPSGS